MRFAWMLVLVVAAGTARGEETMSYLDDGAVRVGVDLSLGGSITYLSKPGGNNLVNNKDFGRQIQMSHYSGPTPFTPPGKKIAEHWRGLGWNPIQTGDVYGNRSKVLEHRKDGKEIFVRCVPMHWPLENVPGECTFESRIRLDGPAVRVTGRIVNKRDDLTQYPARDQELPAVYCVGTLDRLMTYDGDRPFTDGALRRITKADVKPPGPWTNWLATESWAALVDANDFGVGVWHPGCVDFKGGLWGDVGRGGPRDDPTGYLSPIRREILDHDADYSFDYVLIVGTLAEIRKHVYDHTPTPTPPDWSFENDRRHWYYAGAKDAGWPVRGKLDVTIDGGKSQLIGPRTLWRAEDGATVRIEAAFRTKGTRAKVLWDRLEEGKAVGGGAAAFAVRGDGVMRVYEIDLSKEAGYRGMLAGLKIQPAPDGQGGDGVEVRRVWVGK